MRRTAARLAVAAVVAGAALLVTAGGATASPQPELVVEVGRPASASYDPLVGNFNNEGNHGPYPGDCSFDRDLSAICDVTPLTVRLGDLPRGVHALLTITVSWDDVGGTNTLDARLWDRGDEFSTVPVQDDVASSTRPIKGPTIPRDGEQRITWIPPPGDLYVTVVNMIGANTGYRLHAAVELLEEPSAVAPDGATPAAPSRLGVIEEPAMTDAAPPPPANTGLPAPAGEPLGDVRGIADRAAAPSIAGRARSGAIALAVVALVANLVVVARRRGLLGAVRRRYGDLRLFWKLLVPFAVALCVIGTAGTWLTVRYLSDRAQQSLDSRLLESAFGATTHLRDQELYLLEAVRFAANVEGMADAVTAGDAAEAAAALGSAVAVRTDLDIAAVTGLDGVSLVDYVKNPSGFTTRAGTDWASAPPVQEVIAGVVTGGDKRAGLVLVEGDPLLVTASPVRTDRVVGVAIAAVRADRLAAGAAERASAAVAIYDDTGEPLHRAGSFAGSPPEGLAGGPVRIRSTIDGRDVTTLYQPVLVRGDRIGTVAVRLPADSTFGAVRGAGLRIGALVAAAMLAVVAFGVVVSRHVVRRVRSLVDANRTLGRGDLAVRAPVMSGDELGELATGFNTMAEQLQASYEDLERRVAQRTEELSRLYEENVRVNEARTQLFAGVSHELRTPLFAILANAEMLADPELTPDDPEELQAQLLTIDRAAKSLLTQVDEILDLARAEQAGVDLDLRPLTLRDAWHDVERSVAALARAADLTLHVDVPAELPPVLADAGRVRQILLNLASNAVKYTPAGGSVDVAATTTDGGVEVTVADTGIGIPPGVGDDVFEPYYRVGQSTGRSGWASTGLGLALTRRLVEAHGGRITYRANNGAPGTTFRFTLPLAAGERGPST